jgi:hypothetical protein
MKQSTYDKINEDVEKEVLLMGMSIRDTVSFLVDWQRARAAQGFSTRSGHLWRTCEALEVEEFECDNDRESREPVALQDSQEGANPTG